MAKIQITEYSTMAGSHFLIVPLPDGYPNELALLDPAKRVIEMDDLEAKKLLRKQGDALMLQLDLLRLHKGLPPA